MENTQKIYFTCQRFGYCSVASVIRRNKLHRKMMNMRNLIWNGVEKMDSRSLSLVLFWHINGSYSINILLCDDVQKYTYYVIQTLMQLGFISNYSYESFFNIKYQKLNIFVIQKACFPLELLYGMISEEYALRLVLMSNYYYETNFIKKF